jgi:membrane protein YdbS with pleckstrin-like domain
METVVFASKVDGWLAAVLILSALVSLGAAGFLLLTDPSGGLAVAAVLVLLGVALPLWLMASTRYTLTDSELRVVSGPFRWRVPLREIRAVTATRNPLSSPALSLDRLRIDYGRAQWLMISPREKENFLRELEVRRSAGVADD